VHKDIVQDLYSEYQINGYISENHVLDSLIGHKLPLDEIDAALETLLAMGVIIRDDSVDVDDIIYDRSQIDYELVFKEVIEIDVSLTLLINEIRDIKPPQHREWQNLMLAAKNGNVYARERIILMYMRVAVNIALWYYKKLNIPLADAIQNGCLGLIMAFEKFDLGRQDSFSQYAPFWIRQYITRYANPPNSLFYYPVHMKEKLFSVLDIVDDHDCDICGNFLTCPNLLNEIADKLYCNIEEAIELLWHLTPIDSLERMLDDEENSLSDNNEFAKNMSDEYFEKELRIAIANILEILTPVEKGVIIKRFGLFGNVVHTLEEVGNKLGVTRERVRQIEAKSLRQLRKHKQINKIKIYL